METVAPALRAVRWYAAEIVVGIAVVATALAALALTGAAVDDAAIDADRGIATAEVLDSSFARTLIRFPSVNGQSVVPERGVQYPRGLATGDTVVVEYALSDPEQVRVAGRSVVDGIVPVSWASPGSGRCSARWPCGCAAGGRAIATGPPRTHRLTSSRERAERASHCHSASLGVHSRPSERECGERACVGAR